MSLQVVSELHKGSTTLGEDSYFKDFSRTNSISEEVDEVLVVDILLDFSNSADKGVLSQVNTFKPIGKNFVPDLSIHRDVVEEGAVKLSDFRVVNLSGQSKNS